jgi:hypothetical protein
MVKPRRNAYHNKQRADMTGRRLLPAPAPRTDPGTRLARTRLLPRVRDGKPLFGPEVKDHGAGYEPCAFAYIRCRVPRTGTSNAIIPTGTECCAFEVSFQAITPTPAKPGTSAKNFLKGSL